MDRSGSILDQIDILAPNAVMQTNPEILVGKFDDIPAAAGNIQIICYALGDIRDSCARVEFDLSIHAAIFGNVVDNISILYLSVSHSGRRTLISSTSTKLPFLYWASRIFPSIINPAF